jgi:hypothetical protein
MAQIVPPQRINNNKHQSIKQLFRRINCSQAQGFIVFRAMLSRKSRENFFIRKEAPSKERYAGELKERRKNDENTSLARLHSVARDNLGPAVRLLCWRLIDRRNRRGAILCGGDFGFKARWGSRKPKNSASVSGFGLIKTPPLYRTGFCKESSHGLFASLLLNATGPLFLYQTTS